MQSILIKMVQLIILNLLRVLLIQHIFLLGKICIGFLKLLIKMEMGRLILIS